MKSLIIITYKIINSEMRGDKCNNKRMSEIAPPRTNYPFSAQPTCDSSDGDHDLEEHDGYLGHHVERKSHHVEQTHGHESL